MLAFQKPKSHLLLQFETDNDRFHMINSEDVVSSTQFSAWSLISVIIPIYNVEKYLRECLDSVVNQTYQNLEIICINDGSSDNSREIVLEYQKIDSRIILVDKENGGLSDARNVGLDRCRGDCVFFLDSDDWLDPTTIEILLHEHERSGADIVACGAVRYQDGTRPVLGQCENYFAFCKTGIESCREIFGQVGVDMIVACFKLYDISLFANMRYPVGVLHEDEFVTYRLLARARLVSYLPRKMVMYRQRADSITATRGFKNRLMAIEAFRQRFDFFCATDDYFLMSESMVALLEQLEEAYKDKECDDVMRVTLYNEAFSLIRHYPYFLTTKKRKLKHRLFLFSPSLFWMLADAAGRIKRASVVGGKK